MNLDDIEILKQIKTPETRNLATQLAIDAAKLSNEPEQNKSFERMMFDPVFIAACMMLDQGADDLEDARTRKILLYVAAACLYLEVQ